MLDSSPGQNEPRLLLQNEFERRLKRNPRYSLRAFARSLGVSHSLISLVLNGKRRLSRKTLARITENFGLGREELARLQPLLGNGFGPGEKATDEYQQISLDTFALLSDWHHYAILSLLELPHARLDPRWIARRLRISELTAKLAIERLKRLELIAQRGGRWRQCSRPLKVENTVSTAATRNHQRQILRKAEDSLESDPFEMRDFSSITFAMDAKDIPYARKRIQQFRRKLVAELESNPGPNTVYHLAVQIYPVSRREKSK